MNVRIHSIVGYFSFELFCLRFSLILINACVQYQNQQYTNWIQSVDKQICPNNGSIRKRIHEILIKILNLMLTLFEM